jgi:hypothetical protein
MRLVRRFLLGKLTLIDRVLFDMFNSYYYKCVFVCLLYLFFLIYSMRLMGFTLFIYYLFSCRRLYCYQFCGFHSFSILVEHQGHAHTHYTNPIRTAYKEKR